MGLGNISNVASGDGPPESQWVSTRDDVQLVGTTKAQKLNWLTSLWFIAAFCALAPSACAFGISFQVWEVGSPRDQQVTGSTGEK